MQSQRRGAGTYPCPVGRNLRVLCPTRQGLMSFGRLQRRRPARRPWRRFHLKARPDPYQCRMQSHCHLHCLLRMQRLCRMRRRRIRSACVRLRHRCPGHTPSRSPASNAGRRRRGCPGPRQFPRVPHPPRERPGKNDCSGRNHLLGRSAPPGSAWIGRLSRRTCPHDPMRALNRLPRLRGCLLQPVPHPTCPPTQGLCRRRECALPDPTPRLSLQGSPQGERVRLVSRRVRGCRRCLWPTSAFERVGSFGHAILRQSVTLAATQPHSPALAEPSRAPLRSFREFRSVRRRHR